MILLPTARKNRLSLNNWTLRRIRMLDSSIGMLPRGLVSAMLLGEKYYKGNDKG